MKGVSPQCIKSDAGCRAQLNVEMASRGRGAARRDTGRFPLCRSSLGFTLRDDLFLCVDN
jgi:hypothetical protein